MMIIMTLKIITEIVNQIKSNQIKSNQNKRKKETQQQKSNKNTHPKGREKKNGSSSIQQQEQNNKKQKNKYSVTKMEQRDAKGSADSQNLISIFEKHHRCPN